MAWDCATGSGQVARGLAPWFKVVVATDASVAQLHQAIPHPRIAYRAARAEASPFSDGSVDLVTVAQALHWFDTEAFFDELQRVLSSRGLIAIWSYSLVSVTPEIDGIIKQLYFDTLGGFWPPERRLVEDNYADIGFPFRRLYTPGFSMTANWCCADLLGYLRTWSAAKAHQEATGFDAVTQITEGLQAAWGDEHSKRVSWPLNLMLGRLAS